MTTSKPATLTDAAGRTIRAGDTVGGTTSGRYQTTVLGPVVQFGRGKVKVRLTNRPDYGGLRDANGDDVWISTDRVFLVHPATERRFKGFRTPDGRVWTVAARTKGVLWEAPLVPQRYEGHRLRSVYQGKLQPVWETTPATAQAAPGSCDCYGPTLHGRHCPAAVVHWGRDYNATVWYRDRDGAWWCPDGLDARGCLFLRLNGDPAYSAVPVDEIETEHGPLRPTDHGTEVPYGALPELAD
ncbi:hypothetical protein [Streptomyces sp. KAU_LT]|uniref:hypothetical protein n=1 Tax=Streptomyces sp. KAU_LT TaxID=3046669 RepID=UPI0024B82C38|nr:hypothetical protein [Streptomyces sp. KAU_LT]MDI9836228.1 hypothetical protein [Streptomyces sp. KAU_LT]